MDDTKIRGEYWIINGSIDFADGDVGDVNHAIIANNHVIHQFISEIESLADEYGLEIELERYGDVDSEQIAKVIDEVYEKLLEQGISSKEIYQIIQSKIGADAEALQILRGGGNSRLYVMKHDGWIAVRSNNAELYGYDSSKQRYLANGVGDILYDEGNEHFNPSEVEIAVYDHKSGKSWYATLEDLESQQVVAKTQQPIQTTYNKPIIPSLRPADAPKSYPNQWTQAAQGAGIVGPGQDLWRGTSECLNFKEFFENIESQCKKHWP